MRRNICKYWAKIEVILLMELELNGPLQWCICLLHTNEVLLRHLPYSLDVATIGPTAFLWGNWSNVNIGHK